MTVAGFVFDENAWWLLIAAVVCYGIALMSNLQNRRRLANEAAPGGLKSPTAQTSGIIIDGCNFGDKVGA